jgi:hypothetical protein
MLKAHATPGQQVSPKTAHNDGCMSLMRNNKLRSHLNEVYLFHGTSESVSSLVMRVGFNERFAKDGLCKLSPCSLDAHDSVCMRACLCACVFVVLCGVFLRVRACARARASTVFHCFLPNFDWPRFESSTFVCFHNSNIVG